MDSEQIAHADQKETLNPGAEYGSLPFDRFVVENWDYSKPVQQDQEQWNELAEKWLSMSRIERSPYWAVWFPSASPHPNASFLPTRQQIIRILAPHQTIKERNISQHAASILNEPVWIRTCYASDLSNAYEEMGNAGLRYPENIDRFLLLDDEALYSNPDKDWSRVFLRLPLLPDAGTYLRFNSENDKFSWGEYGPKNRSFMPLFNASCKDKQAVYLLDEEALRERLVKILYLDVHGNAVWKNKIAPEDIEFFEARYFKGSTLGRIMEKCADLDEPSLLQPGALLEYDE
ncbi:uncharacterized protein K460DRAFT_413453 [Cucurbitaria berberidis CBS 394.84]|uniref:Uncharacterized protein n=1 Tax=Cucurbitaria berberidis CBS 394.84 TaxID=1168544 RepID=A0A9P4GV71_9PLEO|nr:uncharacterized protein K460DRAFT_413453 [Cucurbitaria berberidis CBS 394.84]KAF1851965.1 hypothetical protein K460DRAFT_413453 [Cucurbitaria berberidis CBS 394.84]